MTMQVVASTADLLFTMMNAPGPTLSARQLNRTVLDRQLLLTRAEIDIPTTLQRVGGLQTQYAPSGYIGLWSRLSEFERAALTRALEDRSVIQATLMRCTIHMVAADDFWPMCAGIRKSRREWWLRIARSRKLPEISHDALAEAVRDVFTDGALTRNEVVAAIERAGFAPAFKEGVDLWLDMVRVPPWGTWERRRADRYGLAEQWLPRVEVEEAEGLRLLLKRYLQAFGPAALVDAARWAGLPRSRLEPIGSKMELVTYKDDKGASLLDLAGLELADATTPAPVRFLPTWDATLLVHCRRSGILPEEFRQAIFHTRNPQSVGTVLVDGAVAATWAWRSDHVEVDELAKLTARQGRDVAAEAEQLTAFYRG